MSSRAFGLAALTLSLSLLLAAVMLAMWSAESDQPLIQAPHAFSAGEVPGPSTGDSCGQTTPHRWVSDLPSDTALIAGC